jgi:cysteine synthase A
VDAFICATGTGGTLSGIAHYFRDLHANGEKKVESWLADPPGSVLHSYVISGGKLKERVGGSITEGKFQFIRMPTG